MGLKFEIDYATDLVKAGLNGVTSAWETSGDRVVEPLTKPAVWVPATIGAATGLVGVYFQRDRKRFSSFIVGGLIGSAVGLSAAVAWASREFSGSAVRGARDRVNTVRDTHWLAHHPIDYA